MKHVVQNYKTGELSLIEAPVPACKSGGVLVRSMFSLISAGTELMKVGEAKLSLIGKAKARPDQVKKVMGTVAQQGLKATYDKVMNKLDSYTPLGYSLCGVVIDVGAGAEEFAVGDIVACAGNTYALHAEINWVPTNLCVKVPDGVDPRHAAFSTVGAIAMQGLRQGEPSLGDTALVIGLGLVGQLLVQQLVANGVRVIGADVSTGRNELAVQLGAIAAGVPGSFELVNAVQLHTNGHGVDQVFLTAGGDTNQPVELAAELARDRARIIDIGKVSLDLPWNAYYEKELEVRFSRSYGPGRYDPSYEEEGKDYPIGYVRWTERRNLECFVDLLARKQIDLEPLISHVAPFDQAVELYGQMSSGAIKGVGFLFEYPDHVPLVRSITNRTVPVTSGETGGSATFPRTGVISGRPLRVGFIGAGNYASSMLLPHLKGNEQVSLVEVATTSALSAMNASTKFGFERASTDSNALLADESIDAVFIVTRHNSHAALAAKALRAGKAVFVEKPLAVTEEQLQLVLDAVGETGNDRLMVGFNRRFAPLMTEMKDKTGRRTKPAMVRYLVNAGKMDATSWYLRADSEGTRFEGEGGHFIDTVSWWLGTRPVSISAQATPDDLDNVHTTITYADGSVASITYATGGHARFPKETFEVVADGKVARLDNFSSAGVWGAGRRTANLKSRGIDKGQSVEVAAFVDAVRQGRPMPISLTELADTTRATLAVSRSLATGETVKI
jgi:predicted dehydrogenase/threonine dehydrogenase-like Zn-dependent dehydrogenase